MWHKHSVRVRWYAPNQVWVIEQNGHEGEDVFLYPNGEVRVGYTLGQPGKNAQRAVEVELEFD